MAQETITGPLRNIVGPDGVRAPFYVVPFDRSGACLGPVSRDLLVKAAIEATDVFVFSHGWNNDWEAAIGYYDAFIDNFLTLRHQVWPTPDREYRPLLAGVFWPSTALVGPHEQPPDIAGEPGEPGQPGSPFDDEVQALITELAVGLTRADTTTLRDLASRPSLDDADALTLARLLSSMVKAEDEAPEDGPAASADPEALVEAAKAMSGGATASSPSGQLLTDDPADDPGDGSAGGNGAQAAFDLGNLDPRNLIRMATVLLMKDRAGTVGAHGVADLLLRLQAAPTPGGPRRRIHLIGHSYGAKVVLSALSTPAARTLSVDSVLLLQPAVSAYCFAPAGAVPGTGQAGGYEPALHRTRLPVLTTFSRHDFPLNHAFELAARRRSDLGEEGQIAGGPSQYSALGGPGPLGTPALTIPAVVPTTPYEFPSEPAGHLIAIRGDDVISGHGDVTTPATAWMLLSQVRG